MAIDRRRRPRVEAAVVATVLVGFLVLAVMKPWEANGQRQVAGPSDLPASSAAAVASAGSASARAALPTPIVPFPSDAALVAATGEHRAWGVRAVVLSEAAAPAGGPVVERWLPSDVNSGASLTLDAAPPISGPTDTVIALGVTAPDGALPLDLRFWRLDQGSVAERIVPIPIPGPLPATWLWLPDPADATALGTWPAGMYRIDVLLGPRIVRLLTTIPTSAPSPARDGQPAIGPPLDVSLARIDPGPFSIADGLVTPIVADTSPGPHEPPVDEPTAWLDIAGGGVPLSSIGRISSRDVSAIGLQLPAGAVPLSALVVPGSATVGVRTSSEVIAALPGGRQAIVVRPIDQPVFSAGLYQLIGTWRTEPGAQSSATWQFEIVPSTPALPPGSPLGRVRGWAAMLDQPNGQAGQPLVYLGRPATRDQTCGGSRIGATEELVGLVAPPGTVIRRVRVVFGDTLGGTPIPIGFAAEAIPRLTIVAFPPGGLSPRAYDLVIDVTTASGPGRLWEPICVG